TFTAGSNAQAEKGKVTIDDASFMILDFEGKNTLGSCDTSRFAGGRRNMNYFEIYGSKGSLVWNLEHMNQLQYMNLEDKQSEQGFRDIMVTYGSHPYTGHWWAPGHIVGYETTFVNAAYDYLTALKEGKKISPNFADGVKILQVLEAAQKSAAEGRKVKVSEIK
ncbi:MAG: Gfo/Idh/MocA family oxidoreductase, partial [Eubacteriales bacterium]